MSTPTPPQDPHHDPYHGVEQPVDYTAPSAAQPTHPQPAPEQPAPAAQVTVSAPKRRRVRTVALVAAGGLAAAVVGLSASAVTHTIDAATMPETSQGTTLGQGSSGSSGSSGSGSSGSGGTTVPDWGQQLPGGSDGSGGYGQGSGGYGQGGSGSGSQSGSGTVDSDPATDAESEGVALIDTVLTNGEAAGTGIVLTSDGEVLTNYHVVEGSTSIKVTIASTGKTYTGEVVGHDQSADVALVQLKNASGLDVATIDDDTLALGDDVTAVGNAGGTGELTAADGDVTDLSASITTASENGVQGESLKGLIETSADVVAGDSGGPLIDDEGEVVGIDTAASSGQVINGYAIPIDDALAIVQQIQSGDETSQVQIGPAAFLGVELGSTTQYPGRSQSSGALISGVVTGGAADKAGLEAGDTVTKVGGTAVDSADALSTAIGTHDPGDQVKVTWTTTDGSTEHATMTLGKSPVA